MKQIFSKNFPNHYPCLINSSEIRIAFSRKILKKYKVENLLKNKNEQSQGGLQYLVDHTAQKMNFYIKDFFSKFDQIHSFQRIWSHLLKKSLIKN